MLSFKTGGEWSDKKKGGSGSGTPPASTPNSSGNSTPQTPTGNPGQGTSSMESSFAGFLEIDLSSSQNLSTQHLIEGDEDNACIDPTLLPAGSGQYYFMPNMFPIQSVTPTPVKR